MRTQVEANYAADSLLFVGLRGVGKTVLLKEIRDRYNTAGWLATYVQIRPSVGVDRAFGELALRSGSSLRSGSKLLQAMKRLSKRGGSLQLLGQGIAVGPAGDQPEGYGELLEVLSKLGEAARDDGVGVALIVDELQSLKVAALGDLVSLVFALRDNVPLAFVGCGLNYLPSKNSEGHNFNRAAPLRAN